MLVFAILETVCSAQLAWCQACFCQHAIAHVLQTNAIQPSLVDASVLAFHAGQHNGKHCESS